jgi:hypothetical protein
MWGKLLEELLAVRFPPRPFQELSKREIHSESRRKSSGEASFWKLPPNLQIKPFIRPLGQDKSLNKAFI